MSYQMASESQDDELRPLTSKTYSTIRSADDRNLGSNIHSDRTESRRNNKDFRNKFILALVAIIAITCVVSLGTKKNGQTVLTLSEQSSKSSASKPNFVFVLIDDVGWNSLGYQNYDMSFATPHMTALAQDGIILSNYYSQEICSPARASLLTGRYPITVGVVYGAIQPAEKFALDISETLLPEVLKEYGGYTNYILGKWNLGHYNPKYLPTARGFDYFLGFMDGHNYYWSKRDPQADDYIDFMYSDTSCYNMYNGTDMETYSTYLYENKIVNIIASHDYDESPMFLYYAAQAAHDPFNDYGETYPDGIPSEYIGTTRYAEVQANVEGGKRQQYAMSLMLLDDSIHAITTALTTAGQLDNTYIIVASDNGGCYSAGGKNGPLRGSKGSLYEGGTKVDAFIYSPLLSDYAGSTYNGIMHVSDWFPTILGFAGITEYAPTSIRHTLDGVDQSAAILTAKTDLTAAANPRTYLLYGLYANVTTEDFDLYANAPVGIRNAQYKLLHAYTGNAAAKWYATETSVGNDDDITGYTSCSQSISISGVYTKFLFDLVNDPYETTNLYGLSDFADVQAELYAQIEYYAVRTRNQDSPKTAVAAGAYALWQTNGYFVQPWSFDTDDSTSPKLCSSTSIISPDTEEAPNKAKVDPGQSDPGRVASKTGTSGSKTTAATSTVTVPVVTTTTTGTSTATSMKDSVSSVSATSTVVDPVVVDPGNEDPGRIASKTTTAAITTTTTATTAAEVAAPTDSTTTSTTETDSSSHAVVDPGNEDPASKTTTATTTATADSVSIAEPKVDDANTATATSSSTTAAVSSTAPLSDTAATATTTTASTTTTVSSGKEVRPEQKGGPQAIEKHPNGDNGGHKLF